jgi:hypothetical protein
MPLGCSHVFIIRGANYALNIGWRGRVLFNFLRSTAMLSVPNRPRGNSIITPTRVSPGGDPQSIGCGRSEVVFSQITAID